MSDRSAVRAAAGGLACVSAPWVAGAPAAAASPRAGPPPVRATLTPPPPPATP